jgi:hypothetical protein
MLDLQFTIFILPFIITLMLLGWGIKIYRRILRGLVIEKPALSIITAYLGLSFIFATWFYIIRDGFVHNYPQNDKQLELNELEESINNTLKDNYFGYAIEFDKMIGFADSSTAIEYIFSTNKIRVSNELILDDFTEAGYQAAKEAYSFFKNLNINKLKLVSYRENPAKAIIILSYDPDKKSSLVEGKAIKFDKQTDTVKFDYNLSNFSNKMIVASRKLSFLDLLYFSILNLSTANYGDIVPVFLIAKISSVLEVVLGIFLISIIGSILIKDLNYKKTNGNNTQKQCEALTKKKGQCKRKVLPNENYCYYHLILYSKQIKNNR